MGSPFDSAFSRSASTFHAVFGDLSTYTVKATAATVSLRFMVDRLELTDRYEGHVESRGEHWQLVGSLLKSDVALPAKGDTITLPNDSRVYRLTQSPMASEDGNQWICEFSHIVTTARGGQRELPVI